MKKIQLLFLTIIFVICLTACGGKKPVADSTGTPTTAPTEKPTEAPAEPTAEPTKVPAYPVTITDQAGRQVTIEKEPQKLVSGYYISTSLLIALDLDDRLVGIEAKAKSRNIYKLSAEHLLNLPSVGTAKEFDLEGCVALSPDLVILPLKLKSAAETLEGLGIKVILVNPESEELLAETIDIIAKATNKTEEAAELTGFIEEKTKFLQDKLKEVTPKSVYIAGTSALLATAGDKMYQDKMIAAAGGRNVAGATIHDKSWAQTDYESILGWNPEYIIIAAEAAYTAEEVINDPALALCDAVVKKNVYHLPNDVEAWDSPVPSGILGSVWTASVLYPELITEEIRDSIIEEYYEKFYNFKYSAK